MSRKHRYPKSKMTAFIQLSKNDCVQVNLHKGNTYNYWFIQPSEKPIKMVKGKIPELLKGKDLSDLGL